MIIKAGYFPLVKQTEQKDTNIYSIRQCTSGNIAVFHKELTWYSGHIYDLTLATNHIMYIMRNGKCFWGSNCRCYEVPILSTEEEFWAVNNNKPSINEVQDVPPAMHTWLNDNALRIQLAKVRGTLPYWIKDNGTFKKGEYQLNIAPAPKLLSTLEKAQLRHEARTKEQAEAIQKAWNKRKEQHQAIIENGKTVIVDAMDYPQDINQESWNALREAVQNKDIRQIQILSEKIGNEIEHLNNEYNSLSDIIPDIDQWKHQFNIDELKQVHSAVENKLAQWSNLSLEEQKKKLDFEANTFLGGNMHGVQQKYPTWQVSQSAYLNQLKNVNYKIDIQNIENQLSMIDAEYLSAHPKAKKLANLWGDTQLAIHNKENIETIKDKLQLTLDEYYKKINKKKIGIKFDADCYTQERKDKAVWFKRPEDANDYFFEKINVVEQWEKATLMEKEAIYDYTAGSSFMTETLRAIKGHYYTYDTHMDVVKEQVEAMTNLISRCSDGDCWIKRDTAAWDFANIFGKDLYEMERQGKLQDLINVEGIDKSFISCGNCKDTYFKRRDLIYNIYCPQKTQMIYAEPFSAFGQYKSAWDGKTKPTELNENEIILQRGTKFRCTKIEKKDGVFYVNLEVIEQNPLPIKDVVKTSEGYYFPD